jgi:hypothetical protein
MNKLLKSLIRTYSPLLVGFLAEWFAPIAESMNLEDYPGGTTAAVAALYYFFPRVAEHLGYKKAGIFLGATGEPNYGSAEDSIIAAEDAELPWGE